MNIKSRACIRPWILLCLAWLLSPLSGNGQLSPEWPPVTQASKPWTRWWWQGSAVNKADLTATLEAYQRAGLGGVEITPIYGVAGYEQQFIPFLSPEWMAMLDHTLAEAERLDLGVDMATGTGWPFGGPWVGDEDACKYAAFNTYTLKGGERLSDPIQFQQETIVRAVGSQVYQLYGDILRSPGETVVGSAQNPQPRAGSRPLTIDQLVEPISANKDLQTLALDQIRFPKPLPLQALMAYSDSGQVLDLTRKVDKDGTLNWVAPPGDWTLHAAFQGWHGKMVERAAPGGEGNVIDHFATAPIKNYLRPFDRAFAGHEIGSLRAFFNDSYEVDDARGEGNWTPAFFAEFKKRRGYDLRQHLPALLAKDSPEKNARVLCDYRETISDLLLDTFTTAWRKWSRGKGALVRNQAHGSPANLLDLYASSDIPETEGTEIARMKFASSAAHVTGKKLTSAEAATWLNEHFRSTLAEVKESVDRYFLGGVNHVCYHGSNYSPKDDQWPGWLFYAAVHFNPRNSWWEDFGALNRYVARAQSFLQAGKPDNDVLLYFPIYDQYSERGNTMLVHFDGGVTRFTNSVFKAATETLQQRGYAFDFISDRQLRDVKYSGRSLATGGVSYRTVVVPACRYLPLETLEKLIALARAGATVVMLQGLPGDVAGFSRLESRQKKFRRLLGELQFSDAENEDIKEGLVGKGVLLLGDNLERLLSRAGVQRETMVDQRLQFIRRSHPKGHCYFIANWSDGPVDGWVPLAANATATALFNPMTGQSGRTMTRTNATGGPEVYLQLARGESCIVQTFGELVMGIPYPNYKPNGTPQEITGAWTISFVAGGPELPAETRKEKLASWTEFEGDEVKRFSGTARYALVFTKPAGEAAHWLIDLGRVHESAQVRLNGKDLGTLVGPTFRLPVEAALLTQSNVLEIKVSNLMANRIADMDRRKVAWKKFYNVNFPARLASNRGANGLFDASRWEPLPSGLLGPVTLTPVERVK